VKKPSIKQIKKTALRIGVKSALAVMTPTVIGLSAVTAVAIETRLKLEKKAANL